MLIYYVFWWHLRHNEPNPGIRGELRHGKSIPSFHRATPSSEWGDDAPVFTWGDVGFILFTGAIMATLMIMAPQIIVVGIGSVAFITMMV